MQTCSRRMHGRERLSKRRRAICSLCSCGTHPKKASTVHLKRWLRKVAAAAGPAPAIPQRHWKLRSRTRPLRGAPPILRRPYLSTAKPPERHASAEEHKHHKHLHSGILLKAPIRSRCEKTVAERCSTTSLTRTHSAHDLPDASPVCA